MNDEDEPSEVGFDDEYYDDGEMGMGEEDKLFEDDIDEGGSDDEEEAEEDDGSGESNVTESRIGHCRYCGAEVILDELPDSISRDAFEDFGICLNCQWGIFMQNGGHF
jgi:hypothetical protein